MAGYKFDRYLNWKADVVTDILWIIHKKSANIP